MTAPAQAKTEAEKKVETRTELEVIQDHLNKMEEKFQTALPPGIDVKRFMRVTMTALQKNPSLLTTCERNSLFVAFLEAAQDGLLVDDREATIIPFKGKAKYMPMVGGILKKARNSGEVRMINAIIVHVNDALDYWEDENGPHFKHVPNFSNPGPEKLTLAYAITKDGTYTEPVTMDQMAAIELCCQADKSPWKGKFRGEMMRKSALRRLLKYRVPTSADLDTVIRRDDEMYDLEQEERLRDTPRKPGRLGAILEATGTPSPVAASDPAGSTYRSPEEEAVVTDFAQVMREKDNVGDLTKVLDEVRGSAKLSKGAKDSLEGLYIQRVKQLNTAKPEGISVE